MNHYSDSILNGKKHIHFIGIGGSGMFPLAQILHAKGYYLTGSDNNETDTLKMVRNLGIPVYMGQRAENIEGADLIVHTAAIMKDNPELIAAKNSGAPVLERSELLGLITRDYSDTICVSGTHGKTTTTSMVVQMLLETDIDPTCVIGGKLPAIGGSGRVGDSEVMVCEACEFVDTFLKLDPDISIILNIDEDHLDYFKNLDNIIRSFHQFAENTSKVLIINGDDLNSRKAVEGIDRPVITFGKDPANDYYPENIVYHGGVHTSYDLMHHGGKVTEIDLYVPGSHNVFNSVAACAAALYVGASAEQIRTGLGKFKGAGRRFEVLDILNGVTIADDYAHHPLELKVTLETAKKLNFRKIWAVFQPFTYSRTAMLFDDFVTSLSIADHVVLSEIMGSREVNTYNIYAKDLADKIEGCVWFPTFEEIADYVVEHAQPGDLVITLGCGDIYKAAKIMIERYHDKGYKGR